MPINLKLDSYVRNYDFEAPSRVGAVRRHHQGAAPLEARGQDHRVPRGVRQGAPARIPERRHWQRGDAQARHAGLRGEAHGDPPGPYGYGVREELRRGVRLRARPHPHAHRGRLGACRGYDAGRRLRHRHGRGAGHADRPRGGARSAGGAVHRGRGDGPHRRFRASTSSTSTRRTMARSSSAVRAASTPSPRSATRPRRRRRTTPSSGSTFRTCWAATRATTSTRAASIRTRRWPVCCGRACRATSCV